MLTLLAIGDPHFKGDNGAETAAMDTQLRTLISRNSPDVIVVLGDILHKHEKVDLHPFHRAQAFLEGLHASMGPDCTLIILIGNHDRPHNKVYLTDEHVFGPLKQWSRTHVIDTVQRLEMKGFHFVAAPYVEAGRFREALATVGAADAENYQLHGVDVVLAHQEFHGAKMNTITSHEGDPWPETAPLCISGHIHDYQRLQSNLIYTGTPIQHGYADTQDKTISLFTLYSPQTPHESSPSSSCDRSPISERLKWTEQRITLQIPRRIQVTLTPEQLMTYVPPTDTHVKIKLEIDAARVDAVMKLPEVQTLLARGVRIIAMPTITNPVVSLIPIAVRKPFHQRLAEAIALCEVDVRNISQALFPAL